MDDALTLSWKTPESVWKGMLRQDFRTWMEVREEPIIQDAESDTGLGRDVFREAFLGLFVPTAPLAEAPPQYMGHLSSLFQRAEQMPEWKSLREVTGDDESASAIGAAAFAKEMYGKLPPEVQEKLKEAEEKNQEASEAGQEKSDLEDLLSQLPADSPVLEEVKNKVTEAGKTEQKAKAKAKAAAASFEKALAQNQARVQRAIAEASKEGSGQVQELEEAAQALGGDEPGGGWGLEHGAGGKQSLGTMQKLAAYLEKNQTLRKMLKELGWARRAVSEQMRKSKYGRAYMTHYQPAELDFDTILPDELMGMLMPPGHPSHTEFLMKAADDELLHRKFSGEEKAGRGPLVRVRDTSYSMKGDPAALQAAFDLALTQQLKKEGRRVVWVTFSGPNQYEIWEPGKQTTLEELIEKIEFGYWGGTEPYAPLRKAIEIIRSDPEMKRGDILITTDGEFGSAPPQFLKELDEARKEPGLKLAALVIASRPGAADFADSVRMVSDLMTDREKLAEALGDVL